nr:hypothetical protein [Neobacillus sp. Marseille-Q6967]
MNTANNKDTGSSTGNDNNLDRGPIGDSLNSDNAFSENGLENIRLQNDALKKQKEE